MGQHINEQMGQHINEPAMLLAYCAIVIVRFLCEIYCALSVQTKVFSGISIA